MTENETIVSSVKLTIPGTLVVNGWKTLSVPENCYCDKFCLALQLNAGAGCGFGALGSLRVVSNQHPCSGAQRRLQPVCGGHLLTNKSGRKTTLCGGEGSYRGLGVEGRGAMLERVGTVAIRSGGGGSLTHTPHWMDGPRPGLWGKMHSFTKMICVCSLLILERTMTQNERMMKVNRNNCHP